MNDDFGELPDLKKKVMYNDRVNLIVKGEMLVVEGVGWLSVGSQVSVGS